MAARKPRRVVAPDDPLGDYNTKRDFTETAEPAGRPRAARRVGLRFVIQKHAASSLHFDVRLELDGVMKSWACPKGPSLDPTEKRLAVQVEDHPIDYNTFEGVIPKGAYGGGTVMVWDRGTYSPEEGDVASLREALAAGKVSFVLTGKRLRGAWTLLRLRGKSARNWLLIKRRDAWASASDDPVATALTSVVTGRTMDDIAQGRRPRRRRAPA